MATGLTVAFVGGYVLQAFRLERWVEDYVWKIRMGEVAQQEARDSHWVLRRHCKLQGQDGRGWS